jgi:hypothetical protein
MPQRTQYAPNRAIDPNPSHNTFQSGVAITP